MSARANITDDAAPLRTPRAILWRWLGRPLFRFTPRTAYKPRRRLLSLFGSELDPTVKFRNTCRIDQPWNVSAGALVMFGDDTVLRASSPIRIGRRCVISQYTLLMTTMIERDDDGGFRRVTRPIEIGDDCWVATDCTVLPGTVIPEGVVVGARSLIDGELEPWTITSGSPATVRGQRAKWNPAPTASDEADAVA